MIKLLFIPNKAKWYRIQFFNGLAKEMDVEFIFTDEKKAEGLEAKHKILRRYGIYPFSIAFGLIPILIREKYDIVVFPPPDTPGALIDNIFCFIITKLRKKPYIVWSEIWNWQTIGSAHIFYEKLMKSIARVIVSRSGACVTPGVKTREYFISLGVPENKIFTAPDACIIDIRDEDTEKGRELKKKLGIGNKKVILFVSRLIELKGANKYFVNAFAKLRKERDDICLIFIGEGDCKETLQTLCKKSGIEKDTYFLGWIKNEDLAPYYLLCNVFVMPAITSSIAEPWGLALNEAMAFGKPIIATDATGGAYDLIKNGENGFMVPEKDVDALYEAMKNILSDPELEKKMGKESKRIIEEGYTWKNMVDGFKKAIEYASK